MTRTAASHSTRAAGVLVVILALALAAACQGLLTPHPGQPPGHERLPDDYLLVYQQGRSPAADMGRFDYSDAAVWSWNAAGDLELTGASSYGPPFRSPGAIALIPDWELGDFVLEAELLQTGREYGHRDLCLFFGFESPSRFYYAHLATSPDAHAHNVFLVDEADRRALAPIPASGIDWGAVGDGAAWHAVRLERRLVDGTIRVFFDDLDEPIFELNDVTHGFGRVGVGSFDDTGVFRSIRIWAPPTGQRRGGAGF